MGLQRKLLLIGALVVAIVAVGFAMSRRGGVQFAGNSRPAMATAHPDNPQADVSPLEIDFAEQGWNRFRGPNGTGIANDRFSVTKWSETENLAWKTELVGSGSSSPVLTKSSVIVTSYTGSRDDAGVMEGLIRHVSCFDRATGQLRWTKAFESTVTEDPYVGMGLPEHGYATNTPVTNGAAVFVFLGKSGVVALDLEGNELWRTQVGTGSNPKGWGSSSSLILYNDILIVNAAEEAGALIGLDTATGREIWRAEAARLPFTFSTPALVPVDATRTDLVIPVLGEIWGLSPKTGELVWYAQSPINGNVSPCAIVDGDRVIAFGGFRDTGSICVRAGGTGDVTESHIEWTSKATSYVPTPVLVDDRLYWVDDNGRYFCANAQNGEILSKARMPSDIGGGRPVYASMIAVNGKVFVQSRHEGVFVLDSTEELSVLDHNQFASDASQSNATPAVDDGQLFLRSDKFLYCVAQP